MTDLYDSEVFRAACDLAESGVSVIFISDDGTKIPCYSWMLEKTEIPSLARLRAKYRDGVGLGMVTGSVSGNLEVLDSDYVSYKDFQEACRERGLAELLSRLPTYTTGSYKRVGGVGGWQVCYRVPEKPSGNTKLAQRSVPSEAGARGARPNSDGTFYRVETVMETRGEGGYAAIPPTPAHCHEDNEPYLMKRGSLTAIPTITMDERDSLLLVAASFNTFIAPDQVVREKKAAAPRPDGGLRPGDDYDLRGDYEAVLERHGWTRKGFHGDVQKWQRPGKTGPGISGTTGLNGERHFYTFSSSGYPFDAEKFYTPFGVYVTLECNGDFAEGAKRLAAEGYGTPLPKEAKIKQPAQAKELRESRDAAAVPDPAESRSEARTGDRGVSEAVSGRETPGSAVSAPESGIPVVESANGLQDDKQQDRESSAYRAECAVIGCLLRGAEHIETALTRRLGAEHFEEPLHQSLVRGILALHGGGAAIDRLTLQAHLEASGEWGQMQDPFPYLALVGGEGDPRCLLSYLDIVREAAAKRRLQQEVATVGSLLASGNAPAASVLGDAIGRLESVRDDIRTGVKSPRLGTVHERLQEDMRRRKEHPELYPTYNTGLYDLDDLLGGLEPGLLYVVGARPSMGKTSTLFNIVESVSGEEKKTTAVFSLESSDTSIATRFAVAHAKVSSQLFKQRRLNAEDEARVQESLELQKTWPTYLDDASDVTVLDIEARCKEIQAESGLAVVLIDYLGLIQAHKRMENRMQEVGLVIKRLARMAKEMKVAVVALAQINRGVESRENKRPLLSDLRDSGDVEAAADVVILLYRENYYGQKSDTVAVTPETMEETEFIIAKNRDGATGMVKVGFMPYLSKFVTLDPFRDDEPTGF